MKGIEEGTGNKGVGPDYYGRLIRCVRGRQTADLTHGGRGDEESPSNPTNGKPDELC